MGLNMTKHKIAIVFQLLVGIMLLIGSMTFAIYCLNKSANSQNLWIL